MTFPMKEILWLRTLFGSMAQKHYGKPKGCEQCLPGFESKKRLRELSLPCPFLHLSQEKDANGNPSPRIKLKGPSPRIELGPRVIC